MEIKELNVDRHDCGKYACFSTSGSESFARFYFNEDGSINEKLTYSKHYYEQLHPEESKVKEGSKKKEDNFDIDTYSSCYSSDSSDSSDSNDSAVKKIINSSFGKIVFTIIPILLTWWLIKCVLSWITYPARKAICMANKKGNVVWPTYCFSSGDGNFKKFIGTITIILPIWWTIKLIGNLLTILPRLLLNNWTVTNVRFWPKYSFYEF